MLPHLPKSTMHSLLDYEEVVEALHKLARESTGLIKVEVVGKSRIGRDMLYATIGSGPIKVWVQARGRAVQALTTPGALEFLKALAHPARIQVLELLASGERSVSEIQPFVGLEPSHLSQQLGVLRRAGVVSTRKDGPLVIYSIRDPQLVELLAVAKQMLIRSLADPRTCWPACAPRPRDVVHRHEPAAATARLRGPSGLLAG